MGDDNDDDNTVNALNFLDIAVQYSQQIGQQQIIEGSLQPEETGDFYFVETLGLIGLPKKTCEHLCQLHNTM